MMRKAFDVQSIRVLWNVMRDSPAEGDDGRIGGLFLLLKTLPRNFAVNQQLNIQLPPSPIDHCIQFRSSVR
jgi:hypothetical protein